MTFITIVPAICWWEDQLYLETYLFGMAVMPLLWRYVGFLSYHRKVSLAVNLPMFLFSFYQKTDLNLYKWARQHLLLFTFCRQFSDDLHMCHKMLFLLKLHQIHCYTLILPFSAMLSLLVIIINKPELKFSSPQSI